MSDLFVSQDGFDKQSYPIPQEIITKIKARPELQHTNQITSLKFQNKSSCHTTFPIENNNGFLLSCSRDKTIIRHAIQSKNINISRDQNQEEEVTHNEENDIHDENDDPDNDPFNRTSSSIVVEFDEPSQNPHTNESNQATLESFVDFSNFPFKALDPISQIGAKESTIHSFATTSNGELLFAGLACGSMAVFQMVSQEMMPTSFLEAAKPISRLEYNPQIIKYMTLPESRGMKKKKPPKTAPGKKFIEVRDDLVDEEDAKFYKKQDDYHRSMRSTFSGLGNNTGVTGGNTYKLKQEIYAVCLNEVDSIVYCGTCSGFCFFLVKNFIFLIENNNFFPFFRKKTGEIHSFSYEKVTPLILKRKAPNAIAGEGPSVPSSLISQSPPTRKESNKVSTPRGTSRSKDKFTIPTKGKLPIKTQQSVNQFERPEEPFKKAPKLLIYSTSLFKIPPNVFRTNDARERHHHKQVIDSFSFFVMLLKK